MKGILIESIDPHFNLALEEILFNSLENNDYFLLWQNSPSVIVGRHQNTVEEVNEIYVKENNIPVVRRTTGGGAVYHDLGNLNFSFLSSKNKDKDNSMVFYIEPIAKALKSLSFNVEISGRNDLTIEGKKFSGNARRKSGNKVLQHGTLMVNLDISNLSNILTGNPDKYKSKGVPSHKSRVANLIEFMPTVKPEKLMADLKNALMTYCAKEEINLPNEIQEQAKNLAKTKYRTWEWNFGKSPAHSVKFRKRFSWGALEFLADVKDGHIVECKFYGDFFANVEIQSLEEKLTGLAFQEQIIIDFFQNEKVENIFLGSCMDDFKKFFQENIL